ncbi:MAG: sugar-phosphate isomerase [Mucilaginibacter sp.]|nr:sugar-phosphate isomerase [Mucilaginibacter sp.]
MGNYKKKLGIINSSYDKSPFIIVDEKSKEAESGWVEIMNYLMKQIGNLKNPNAVIVINYYPGVNEDELLSRLIQPLGVGHAINTNQLFKTEQEILELTFPDISNDSVFGYMTSLNLQAFFDQEKFSNAQQQLKTYKGLTLVYGYGAYLLKSDPDLFIYADMPRWELQLRYRRKEISNLGLNNKGEKASLQYKRGFFVDWRVADKIKKESLPKWDYVLDTTTSLYPNIVSGEAYRYGLTKITQQPFRVVPFFDPGVWGGQWMKDVFNLDANAINYAWGFDCVPEENSVLLKYGNIFFETPAMNLVFYQSKKLLGEAVQARFGDEFPIRFDFLDTMEGGNLSLQVHPTTRYIQEQFGMQYTQDESYYILDGCADAVVYLALKNDVIPDLMISELAAAQEKAGDFNVNKHVCKWPVKKHDHILIPAGTVHCSGANTMVLEISATPYIFTFKLWDWGRNDLDGKPRPINVNHGKKVIDWNRREEWTKTNLINTVHKVGEGEGWIEEKTGLHEQQFIETRRHWFSKPVQHLANGSVHVLNLIEGKEAVVTSPKNKFEPFVVHYAETFIIPASVEEYTISPYGESAGEVIGTIKAFIRHDS